MTTTDETIVNYTKPKPTPGPVAADATKARLNRPAPGGRAITTSNDLPGVSQAVQPAIEQPVIKVYLNQLNPLLAAAQPLLNEIVALSQMTDDKPIESYRQQLVSEVGKFEMQCGQNGIDEETLIYARYVLCTVLDEMVNKTPWQARGEWNQHSLLAQFHGETGGGEKFFDLLDHLLIHPAKHIHTLELMFVCLNLGFEGKYHLIQRGHLQLEKVKDNLYQAIRLQRGEPDQQLSPHWQGVTDKRHRLIGFIPAWVILAVAGLILVAMFSGFHYLIEEQGDKAVLALENLPSESLSSSEALPKGGDQ